MEKKKFIQEQPNVVGLDAAILMNPETWVASGHVGGFFRPINRLQRMQKLDIEQIN